MHTTAVKSRSTHRCPGPTCWGTTRHRGFEPTLSLNLRTGRAARHAQRAAAAGQGESSRGRPIPFRHLPPLPAPSARFVLPPHHPTSLLRPASMADAVARVVSAVIIGGSVVYTAHTIGHSLGAFRPAANKLADAVAELADAAAEIADTVSNGPRKPRLLHWVTGRGDGGCAT